MGKKRRRDSPRKSRGSQAAVGGGMYGTARELDDISRSRPQQYRDDPVTGDEPSGKGDLLAGQVPDPPSGHLVQRIAGDDSAIPAAFARKDAPQSRQFRAASIPRDLVRAREENPGELDPRADPRRFRQALEAEQPGLAEMLRRGLTPEEMTEFGPAIARAVSASEAEPGTYALSGNPEIVVTDDLDSVPESGGPELVIEDLDPDDPDDSGRIMIGDRDQVRAYHKREKAADRRALKLVPGPRTSGLIRTREAAGEVALRENWAGEAVLDACAKLTARYRNPNEYLAEYLAYFMRNELRQDHLTADHFWPVDLEHGADLPEGRTLAQLIALGLDGEPPCQVSPLMCAKMRREWDAREPGSALILDESRLPASAGFAWLDSPWLTDLAAGYWLPVRAVSWERTMVWAGSRSGLRSLRPGQYGELDSVRIVLWTLMADDIAFGRWKGAEGRAAKTASLIGNLVPVQVIVLPFGTPIHFGRRQRTNGEAMMGVVISLWKTMGEVLVKSRKVQAVTPAIARRVNRTLKHTELRVIYLRRQEYIGDPLPRHPRSVDWKGRWWVDEFYRHLDPYEDLDGEGRKRRHEAIPARQAGLVQDDDHDVCAVCLAGGQSVRVTLVHTFAKGPSWKPFIRPARERTLQKLVR